MLDETNTITAVKEPWNMIAAAELITSASTSIQVAGQLQGLVAAALLWAKAKRELRSATAEANRTLSGPRHRWDEAKLAETTAAAAEHAARRTLFTIAEVLGANPDALE